MIRTPRPPGLGIRDLTTTPVPPNSGRRRHRPIAAPRTQASSCTVPARGRRLNGTATRFVDHDHLACDRGSTTITSTVAPPLGGEGKHPGAIHHKQTYTDKNLTALPYVYRSLR